MQTSSKLVTNNGNVPYTAAVVSTHTFYTATRKQVSSPSGN